MKSPGDVVTYVGSDRVCRNAIILKIDKDGVADVLFADGEKPVVEEDVSYLYDLPTEEYEMPLKAPRTVTRMVGGQELEVIEYTETRERRVEQSHWY